jgi:hypothetical protein
MRPAERAPGQVSANEPPDGVRHLLRHVSAQRLRELAALKDAETPARRRRAQLDDAALNELAAMLEHGATPTIGWWARHGSARAA